MKVNLDNANDMRIKECFDYLQVHELDLKDSQIEFIKSLKKQFRTTGLSEKQVRCLFDIVKYMKPAETLIIRNY